MHISRRSLATAALILASPIAPMMVSSAHADSNAQATAKALSALRDLEASQPRARFIAHDRNILKITFGSVTAEFAKRLSCAKHSRRPVELRIELAEHAKQRSSQRAGYLRSKRFLATVKKIARISGEEFVPAVAGQCHLYRAPGELGEPIGG